MMINHTLVNEEKSRNEELGLFSNVVFYSESLVFWIFDSFFTRRKRPGATGKEKKKKGREVSVHHVRIMLIGASRGGKLLRDSKCFNYMYKKKCFSIFFWLVREWESEDCMMIMREEEKSTDESQDVRRLKKENRRILWWIDSLWSIKSRSHAPFCDPRKGHHDQFSFRPSFPFAGEVSLSSQK